jgi:hypothetical protein
MYKNPLMSVLKFFIYMMVSVLKKFLQNAAKCYQRGDDINVPW